MQQETLYSRKGKTIKDIANNTSKTYPSINLAKKESVILQKSNGGLGAGAVVVV